MARITIRLPDDLDEAVEGVLEYSDSKSEFYRQAAINRLQDEYGIDLSSNNIEGTEPVPDGGTQPDH